MSLFARYRWFALAGAVTLAFAVVSLAIRPGPALTAIVDFGYLFIRSPLPPHADECPVGKRPDQPLLAADGLRLSALGLQSGGMGLTTRCARCSAIPDPWSLDMFLFLHLIPMIAAVGLRPHRAEDGHKFRVGTLDFLLLLVWWVFLYAFVVFPSQYLSLNVNGVRPQFWDSLSVENGVLVLVLGIVARGCHRGWKRIYLNLMAASALYAVASQAANLAVTSGVYTTGSLYDIPLIGAVSWMAATVLSARQWQLQSRLPRPEDDKWGDNRLALGHARHSLLAGCLDSGLSLGRFARAHADLSPVHRFSAMLVLGVFVFRAPISSGSGSYPSAGKFAAQFRK